MFPEVDRGSESEGSASLRLKAPFTLSSTEDPLKGHPGTRCGPTSPDRTPVSSTICNDGLLMVSIFFKVNEAITESGRAYGTLQPNILGFI